MTRRTRRPNIDEEIKIAHTRKKVEINYLTHKQKEYAKKIRENSITFAYGPAGVGKTHVAALHAIEGYTNGTYDKIIVCRPAVEAGGEKIGFLPGNIIEKMGPWVQPIMDVFQTYWSKRTILDMLEEDKIEFAPLSFLRGRTFHHAYVLVDEAQNTTPEQLLMVMTRLGQGSKMVISGDPRQKDIAYSSLEMAYRKLKDVPDVAFMRFSYDDVVRHPTVENILLAWDEEKTPTNDEIGELPITPLPRFLIK